MNSTGGRFTLSEARRHRSKPILKPAGLEASKGLVTTQFLKQPGDPAWANDDEVKAYKIFLKKYAPSANPDDYSVLVAYMNVHGVTLALKKCGDELTRDNLIRQATSFHGERLPMMLPGISISTRPDDYTPFKALRIAIFDGTSWTLTGDPIVGRMSCSRRWRAHVRRDYRVPRFFWHPPPTACRSH